MKKRQIIIVAVPLLILIGGYALMKFFAAQKQDPKKITFQPADRYVTAVPVIFHEMETDLIAYGRVSSGNSVKLVAEAGGRLMRGDVPLKKAQDFRKGQLIFRIDDEEIRSNIKALKSDFLNTMAATLADLKFDFADEYNKWDQFYQKLDIAKPMPALPVIQNQKEKTFLSNRKILTQYYNLRGQEERLEKHRFHAPFDGSIAELSVEEGSIVSPFAQIGRIIRTDDMEVNLPVKTDNIKWVKTGTPVKLSSQDQSLSWTGQVVRIGDNVDPATQSIDVFVSVKPGKENKLYEGLYLMGEIKGKKVSRAMEIPRTALISGNQVFIVENGKLKQREIEIHKMNRETFLFSGLQPGDSVVTESLVGATENMNVKIAR